MQKKTDYLLRYSHNVFTKKKTTYYRFAICALLFLAFFPLQYAFCLDAEDAYLPDISLNNPPDNEPLKQLFHVAEKINDPVFRFKALVEISLAFQEIKNYPMAESALLQASDIMHKTKESIIKNIFISTLVDNYIKIGRPDKALEITKDIDFPDSRNDALINIVIGYIQQGQYEKAWIVAESINDVFSKTLLFHRAINKLTEQRAYAEITKLQDMIENSPPAIRRLTRVTFNEEYYREKENNILSLSISKSKSHKIKTLINLSRQSVSSEDNAQAEHLLERAIKLSKYIKAEQVKDEGLAKIGLVYVEMGELNKAQETANSIRIALYRSEVLAAIAIAYAKSGAFQRAIILTDGIDVIYQKNNALAQIIIHQINAGQEKEADQLMDSLSNGPSGAYVYPTVADYYLQNINYDNVAKVCGKINNQFIKFEILVNMAKKMQNNKDIQSSQQRAFKTIMDSIN